MRSFFPSIGGAALALLLCWATPVMAQHTGADITGDYNTTSSGQCAGAGTPAFLCDGVLIRVTQHSDQTHAWDPTPDERTSGGISFSYLRTDASFNRLAGNGAHGYIVYPMYRAPAWAMTIQFLCAFPLPGQTEDRTANGCGARTDDTSGASAPCQNNGVTTGEQWVARYQPKDGTGGYRACGFDVAYRSTVPGGTANAFNQMIAAMNLLNTPSAGSNISFNVQNELRAQAWTMDQGYKLPIQAFFYTESGSQSGLKDAQADQKDFFTWFSRFVPIVKVGLPPALGQKATFNFYDDDQAVPPPATPSAPSCQEYIQSGEWTQPSWSTHKSLTLTPTACAQSMHWVLVDDAFAEVEKKFGKDPEWKNPLGMRNQFACHVDIAKNKAIWDLEPDRKAESFVDTKKDECNPPFL